MRETVINQLLHIVISSYTFHLQDEGITLLLNVMDWIFPNPSAKVIDFSDITKHFPDYFYVQVEKVSCQIPKLLINHIVSLILRNLPSMK